MSKCEDMNAQNLLMEGGGKAENLIEAQPGKAVRIMNPTSMTADPFRARKC